MFTGINSSASKTRKHHCITRQADDKEIHKSRVFVIDDEEIVTTVIAHYLNGFGFADVHSFNDSVEAMETLQYVKADLVITDLNMPGLGGSYLTRLARKLEHLKNVPIIAITADTDVSLQDKLKANGVSQLLHKPIVQRDLLLSVVEALNSDDQSSLEARIAEKEQMEKATLHREIRNTENALRDVFRK